MANHKGNDYEFISSDPSENADNFDPKWASQRELTTDEERYEAMRKRWGNERIPDPQLNLTFRHKKTNSEENKENVVTPHTAAAPRRNRVVSRRRSRSCVRPYEQLISNLAKSYEAELSFMAVRHKVELMEMLQVQVVQRHVSYFTLGAIFNPDLSVQQEMQVSNLLNNHYQEVYRFLGKKNEHMDICKRYVDEVKAFFNFYQKINDDEVTVQMTDEQYEHTIETEKMYGLYQKFYK